MKNKILELLNEQADLSGLLEEMCNAKTDEAILSVAHKIIAKKTEYAWLILKIEELFNDNKTTNIR